MMSDERKEVLASHNFFAGYCLILPNGKRVFPECYATYCEILLDSLEKSSRTIMKKYYLQAATIEEGLEKMFHLDEEHLMGICEVYSDAKYRFALANFETSRLHQDKTKIAPNKSNRHVDLFLVTSLQEGQAPDSDVVRRQVKQKRAFCTCFICLPGISLDGLTPKDEVDEIAVLKWLKLKILPTKIYVPFRHRRYRYNLDGSADEPTEKTH